MTNIITNLFKKKLVAFVVFLSLLLSPIAAIADHHNLEDQLEVFSAALIAIGAAISSSDDITEDERVSLLSQLILLSQQIVLLQDDVEDELTGYVPEGKVTAREAGLKRIVMDIDIEDHRVVYNAYMNDFSTTTGTTTVVDREIVDFYDEVDDIKEQMVVILSDELGVVEEDVDDLSFKTARNPIRDTDINFHSDERVTVETADGEISTSGQQESLDIALGFGSYSIIESVDVDPGNGSALIRLKTDQDEMMDLALGVHGFSEVDPRHDEARDTLWVAEVNASTTFDYSAKVYFPIPTARELSPSCNRAGCPDPIEPEIQQVAQDFEREDLDEVFLGITSVLPFTKEVVNFEDTTLQFLLTNRAFYAVYDEDSFSPTTVECVDEGDRVLMVGFIESLLTAFGMQYEDTEIDDIVNIVTPTERRDRGTNHCVNVTKYFD